MIGIHQAEKRGNNAVPVGVWIVGESHVILVLEVHETRHRIGTRRIHSYLAVVIDRHEREGWVDCWVRDDNV